MPAVVEWLINTVNSNPLLGESMANYRSGPRGFKKKKTSGVKNPLQNRLRFEMTPGATNTALAYVDSFRSLSRVNRKLIRQGHCLAIESVEYGFIADSSVDDLDPGAALSTIEVRALTAGNTWIVQNAFVKGKALWHEMQDLVLADNPSVSGKWHDYKVQLETDQVSGNTLQALDGDGNPYVGLGNAPEWALSTYVMPQHTVDAATGEPLPADEFTAVLIGDDSVTKRSLVKAYADSRATVQAIDPNVPADMSDSFFNLLTDSGSQEPELADVIEGENDQPPYDFNEYPGAANIAPVPSVQSFAVASVGHPKGTLPGFIAECGLIKFEVRAYKVNGQQFDDLSSVLSNLFIKVNYALGPTKGLMMTPMGQ